MKHWPIEQKLVITAFFVVFVLLFAIKFFAVTGFFFGNDIEWESMTDITADSTQQTVSTHVVFGDYKTASCADNIYIEDSNGRSVSFNTENEVIVDGNCTETDLVFDNAIYEPSPEGGDNESVEAPEIITMAYTVYYGKIPIIEEPLNTTNETLPNQNITDKTKTAGSNTTLLGFGGLNFTANCGDTITEDTTLNADVGPCASNGLIIGADDITVDCAGHILASSTSEGSGVLFNGHSHVILENCAITNFSYGIKLDSGANFNTVQGNTIYNNLYHGIQVMLNSNNNLINNDIHNNFFVGVIGFSSDNTNLTNNIIYDNANDGILFSGNNNIFDNNSVYDNRDAGIVFTGGSNNNLTNNAVYDNSYEGIEFEHSITGAIINNTVNGNGNNGIVVAYSSNNFTIVNNTITDNAPSGIYFDNCSNSYLIGNDVNSNTNYGIYFSQSSYNILANNGACNNAANDTYFSEDSHNNTGNDICNYIEDADTNDYTCSHNCTWVPLLPVNTTITDCQTINASETYSLETNLSATNTCMIIDADNVTFDCKGHTLTGTRAFRSIGVGAINHDNITIQNCIVSNFDYGLYTINSNYDALIDNTAYNNFRGISFNAGSNSVITNNNASFNTQGIYTTGSSSNYITNNIVQQNEDVGIYSTYTSTNNIMTDNVVCDNTNNSFYFSMDSTDNSGDNTCNVSSIDDQGSSDITCTTACTTTFTQGLCNQNVVEDLVLTQDLNCTNPGDNGLNIVEDNVTIDCNGYSIFTPGHTSGLQIGINVDGVNNVTIKNCFIMGFVDGMYFSSAQNGIIFNNTLFDNVVGMFAELGSNNTLLSHNNFTSNPDNGIWFTGVSNSEISNNIVIASNLGGLMAVDGENNVIFNNTVSLTQADGVLVSGENNNVYNNTALDNNGVGFMIYSFVNGNLTDNIAINNTGYGIYLHNSNYNNFTRNTALQNGDVGFYVTRISANNTITDNVVCNNSNNAFYFSADSNDNSGDNICNTSSIDDRGSNNITCSIDCFGKPTNSSHENSTNNTEDPPVIFDAGKIRHNVVVNNAHALVNVSTNTTIINQTERKKNALFTGAAINIPDVFDPYALIALLCIIYVTSMLYRREYLDRMKN